MAAADSDGADGVALLLEIVLYGAHVRVLGQKVDGHKAADELAIWSIRPEGLPKKTFSAYWETSARSLAPMAQPL